MRYASRFINGPASGRKGSSLPLPDGLPAVSNIIANWDAASIAQTDGSSVASWTDTIGGVVAAQSTSANQPSYKLNSLGANPGVVFGGTHYLPIATPGAMDAQFINGNYTILMVIDNVLATTNGCVFGGGAGGNAFQFPANGSFIGRYNGGYSLSAVPATGTAAPAGFTTFGCACEKPSTHNSSTPANGMQRVFVRSGIVAPIVTATPVPTAAYAIGSLSAVGTASFNFKGRVYRILVWNRMLTPNELVQAEIALCTAYGQPMPWAAAAGVALFPGDSITGNVGVTSVTTGSPYQIAVANSLSYGQWSNLGVGGTTLANVFANSVECNLIPTLTGKRTVWSVFEYYNSKAVAFATLLTQMTSGVAQLRGYGNSRVVVGTSNNYGADTVGSPDANRTGYNNGLVSSPPGDQLVQIHTETHTGVPGAAVANPTYFNSDAGAQIHPTDLGHSVIAPMWYTPVANAIAMA